MSIFVFIRINHMYQLHKTRLVDLDKVQHD